MKCYYHNDLDGECSAAIVKNKFSKCECIPINYGFEFVELPKDEIIYLVDFTFDLETMIKLNNQNKLNWIDHHKNICEKIQKEISYGISGIRRYDVAACQLVWKFLYKDIITPLTVKWIGKYDIWEHNKNIINFHYYMESLLDTTPDSSIWDQLFYGKKDLDHVLLIGKHTYNYRKKQNIRDCKNSAFKTKLDGYTVLAINNSFQNSFLLEDEFNANEYDIMAIFYLSSKGFWKVSLRSNEFDKDIDVSEIARKYNGNGHKNAAGFICDKLPFDILGDKII